VIRSVSRARSSNRFNRASRARPTVFAHAAWKTNSAIIPASHGIRTKSQPP